MENISPAELDVVLMDETVYRAYPPRAAIVN
jgi:hypothetical protein